MQLFKMILVSAAFASSAQAQCFVCDEFVEMNENYASCFLSMFDDIIMDIEVSETGRGQVDLSACDPESGVIEASRGGLIEMPDIAGSGSPLERASKSVYIFDMPSAICLKSLVMSHEEGFDPTATFDLYELCGE